MFICCDFLLVLWILLNEDLLKENVYINLVYLFQKLKVA